jgi:hypothetical protein
VVLSPYGFDLHFPYDKWHWASFYLPVGGTILGS